MPRIQIDWISFGISVVLPFIVSVYFFFAYRRQKKNINRLRRKEWNTITELDRKEALIRHNIFIARVSFSMFIVILLFSLTLAAKHLKLF
jgi:hypothetical protein